MSPNDQLPGLEETLARQTRAELIAALTRVFGLQQLDLVEDVVQHAFMRALEIWPARGAPDNPAAWLHRVARNRATDLLRRRATRSRAEPALLALAGDRAGAEIDRYFTAGEIADSRLRMIFTACHPDLPPASQLALALKTLCGFTAGDVADALLIRAENAKKRVTRAKQAFATGAIPFAVPHGDALPGRLDAVHAVMYALFNAGYHSEHSEGPIRHELCTEAIRLAENVCAHRVAAPASFALLSLMCLHAARIPARLDVEGGLLLMEEQDRELWDQELLRRGMAALERSACGERISRYHLEAGIAAKHAVARSFRETDWRAILDLYERLVAVRSSPIAELNRAVALAFVAGPDAAIVAIDTNERLQALRDRYPLLDAVRGGLLLRAGEREAARAALEAALAGVTSSALTALLQRQLAAAATSEPG